jgi:hypothetical protein
MGKESYLVTSESREASSDAMSRLLKYASKIQTAVIVT